MLASWDARAALRDSALVKSFSLCCVFIFSVYCALSGCMEQMAKR